MNIVYATDENFAPITAVSMLSLFDKNKEVADLTVYILDDGLTEQSKKNLSAIAKIQSRGISFVTLMDLEKQLSIKLLVERGTGLTTFYRLFLPTLLPEVDRVLYIDADTMVADNLNSLWDTKFSENEIIAGVIDCVGKNHKVNIGLTAGEPYINGGVILFDLNKMRKQKTEQSFISYLKKNDGHKIPFTDQGVINSVLKGQIKIMPLRFNVVTLIYAASYKDMVDMKRADAYYNKSEWLDAKNNPAIVHFTTCFLMKRPWVKNSNHPLTDIWKSYCSKTPWKEYLIRDNQSKIMSIYAYVYRMLPHRVAANITGFVHGTVKALAERR